MAGILPPPPPFRPPPARNPGQGNGSGRDAPFGPGSAGHGTPIPLNPIGQKQKFLKNIGFYHGAITGVRDHATNMSIQAYKSHRASLSRTKAMGDTPPPKNPPNPPRNPRGPKPPPRRSGGGGGIINPQKYAKNLTRLQYGPIMAQLAHQLALTQAQGAQDKADIAKWYGDAGTQAAAGTAADAAAQAAAQSGNDASDQAIINAMGGGASAGAHNSGTFADLMSGTLRNIGQAQHGYDTGQQTLVGQEGAQAGTDAANLLSQQINQLHQQQQLQQGQRGIAMSKNLTDAQNLRLQQEAGMQAMQLAGLQGAQNLQLGNQRLKSGALSIKAQKQALGGGLNAKAHKVLSDPTARTNLNNQLTSAIMAPAKAGKWLPPNHAWVTMAKAIETDLGSNPHTSRQVFNFVRSIYQTYVQQYEHAHPNDHRDWLKNTGTPWDKATWTRSGLKWKF